MSKIKKVFILILMIVGVTLITIGCVSTKSISLQKNKVFAKNTEKELNNYSKIYRCYRIKDNETVTDGSKYILTKYYQFEQANNKIDLDKSKMVMIYKLDNETNYNNFDITKFMADNYYLEKDDKNFSYIITNNTIIKSVAYENKTYSLNEYLSFLQKNGFDNCKPIE